MLKAHAAEAVKELAELLKTPVVTTLMARGAFPDDHPLCLGMPGMHGNATAITAMQKSDLLITLGRLHVLERMLSADQGHTAAGDDALFGDPLVRFVLMVSGVRERAGDARRFGREDGNVELLTGAAIVAIRSAARQHSPRPRCSASVLISQVMRVMCDARDDLTPTWCSFTETSGGEPSARVVKRPSV